MWSFDRAPFPIIDVPKPPTAKVTVNTNQQAASTRALQWREREERETKPISNQSIMDPAGDAFKWDQRAAISGGATSAPPPPPLVALSPPPIMQYDRARDLDELVDGYGVRYATMVRIGELGFTSSTLIGRILH